MRQTDVLVIGGGAAGLAAAAAAAERGAFVTLVESDTLGGTLIRRIDLSFGKQIFGKVMTGREYVRRCTDKLSVFPRVRIVRGVVTALNADKIAEIVCENDCIEYKARAIVLATGSRERSFGMLDIGGTQPSGIMTAGAALKAMNVYGRETGTRAVVVGSGESGLIVARRLTLEGVKVECVTERAPWASSAPDGLVYCLNDYRIPLMTSAVIREVRGNERVREVVIARLGGGNERIGEERAVKCDLLVIAAGRIPLDSLYGFIKRGADGTFETDSHCMTASAGFFICGNALHVRSGADNVSEEGRIAGTYAADYALRGTISSKAYWLMPTGNVSGVWPKRFVAGESAVVSVRVKKPIRCGHIVLTDGTGNVIARKGRKTMIAGDETRFYLDADDVTCNLYIGAEEEL